MRAEELIAKARPYLPGLPEEVKLLPWEEVAEEAKDERILGLALRERRAIALRPGLEGEAWERVLLHELLHLAEPLLGEGWVLALEPLLHHAVFRGLPPRDLPSLAWASLEELEARLLPGLPLEGFDPRLFPGRLGPFYHALGVIPERELADNPIYLLTQIAAGLPYGEGVWALERLWPEPPLTRRRAALALARRALEASREEWREVERLLGYSDGFPPQDLLGVDSQPLWHLPIPEERRSLTLLLVDTILEGRGEAYVPPEVAFPEEVVAGLLATGRL